MAVYPTAASGAACSSDMETLKRIFDEVCSEHGLCQGSPAAESLAKALMRLFAEGVSDEAEIRESTQSYLQRRYDAGGSVREYPT